MTRIGSRPDRTPIPQTSAKAAAPPPDSRAPSAAPDADVQALGKLRKAIQVSPGVTVEGRFPSARWAWMERLHDSHPELVQREFLDIQKQQDPDNVRAFGTDTPSSADVLLQYAGDPPPGVKVHPRPVLLVHGAAHDTDYMFDKTDDEKGGGLADQLRQQGFKVYAVNFAHNQDDNYLWSQQIGNATARIRALTGAQDVDLVAHSKGGQAAQMYTSDFRQPWMTPYQHDVHRVVFVASPLGGIDYSFRHALTSLGLAFCPDGVFNAPTSWDRTYWWGLPKNTTSVGFGAGIDGPGPDYFPGQRQLLARWDEQYKVPHEQDWKTTYYGGQGLVSHSQGIQHYIDQGGDVVERLHKTPIQPQVALLAGSQPNLPSFLNEQSGPSDGLLFTQSALDVPDGTNVVAEKILPLNHMDLVRTQSGIDAIASMLQD